MENSLPTYLPASTRYPATAKQVIRHDQFVYEQSEYGTEKRVSYEVQATSNQEHATTYYGGTKM